MNKHNLVTKISNEIGVSTENQNKSEKTMKEALEVASKFLKLAAEKQRILENKLEKIASENTRLVSLQEQAKKEKSVLELTDEMLDKGMLKKSEIDYKKAELMSMDDNAFGMFKEAVERVPYKKDENKYASDLTFMYDNNNIKEEKREKMSTALEDYV